MGAIRMHSVLRVLVAKSVLLSLGGCAWLGPSEEELQLQADCTTVFENAATTHEWADHVEMNTWPETYAVTNAGVASRQKARTDVERQFPWIDDAVTEMVQVHGWEKFEESSSILRPYAEALALNELLDGSSASPAFTSTQISQILDAPQDSFETVENVRSALFDRYEPSLFSECPDLTSDSYVDGFEERFSETLRNAKQSAEQMLTILSCETRGVFDGDECAAEDFQVDWSNLERRNPFEQPSSNETTQGLAEFAWCWDLGLEVRPDRKGCW